MQYTLPLASFNRLERLHQRLLAAFGPPPACHRLDPVSQMILAILSARTHSEIALRVFGLLVQRFDVVQHKGRWIALATASFHELDPLLDGINHAERKAVALPRALQEITALRGELTLDFLKSWAVGPALVWLERIYGVGPKTSTATLNLSTLRKRVLVVDTAHWRAARCLGLLSGQTGLERAVRLLNRQAPDRWEAADMEDHHVLMQQLGRAFCTKGLSAACPFRAVCAEAGADVSRERRLETWLAAPQDMSVLSRHGKTEAETAEPEKLYGIHEHDAAAARRASDRHTSFRTHEGRSETLIEHRNSRKPDSIFRSGAPAPALPT